MHNSKPSLESILGMSPLLAYALKELVAEYFMTILFEREMSLLRECLKSCSMDWGHLHERFEGGKHFKVTLYVGEA